MKRVLLYFTMIGAALNSAPAVYATNNSASGSSSTGNSQQYEDNTGYLAASGVCLALACGFSAMATQMLKQYMYDNTTSATPIEFLAATIALGLAPVCYLTNEILTNNLQKELDLKNTTTLKNRLLWLGGSALASAGLIYGTYKLVNSEILAYQNWVSAYKAISNSIKSAAPAILEANKDLTLKAYQGTTTVGTLFSRPEQLSYVATTFAASGRIPNLLSGKSYTMSLNLETIKDLCNKTITSCSSDTLNIVKAGYSNYLGLILPITALSTAATARQCYEVIKGGRVITADNN